MWFGLTIIILFVTICHGSKRWHNNDDIYNNVTVIGLFEPEELEEKIAFRIAVERVNLLILKNARFVPRIEEISPYDSFNVSKIICNVLAEPDSNVVAIFGPQADSAVGIVNAISDRYEIPHIETRWETTTRKAKMIINLYPESELLAQAFMAVIQDMDWKSFTVVYKDGVGLLRLQEVLKAHDGFAKGEGQTPFTVVQLGDETDYRPLLKMIKASGETHIVLDIEAESVVNILKQAKDVGMMGDYNSYILTSLDAHTIDFEEFKYGRTNITALRMLDPSSYILQKAIQDWIFEERNHNRTSFITSNTVKAQSALIYDAVHLYAEAWARLEVQHKSPTPIDCFSKDGIERTIVHSNGFRLIHFMRVMQREGMTGQMGFDEETGHRTFFSIEIVQLVEKGFKKLGSWDPKYGINYSRSTSEMEGEQLQNIKNKTFIVASKIGSPYLEKKAGEGLKDNDRFEGYSLDLIDEIAKELGFTYIFRLVPDGKHGSLNKKTGQWDGLIRELQERRADLAICDLTITFDRRSAVDFTMPFMTLVVSQDGMQYVRRCSPFEWENPHPCNPDPEELELTFTLQNCLWFGIGSLMAQGCDLLPKISPYEWNNPHPCKSDPEVLENNLTLNNLIWLSCGSLMQQGSDIAPQAVSTRLVAGMWWFFTLIMISSYTANLAAFLTMERMDAPISGVEDLASQNKIKYGVMSGGSTANFFMSSNVSMYQRMWSAMESAQPSVFVKNNDEGVERVQKGKRQYAYFMESTSIEYQMERKCDLAMIGGLLDSKGYGIAMPLHSPYRTAISGAVLKMQESGKLQELKTKWWKQMHGGGACDNQDEPTPSNELGLANVGGVFLVLISGCFIAFLVSILEFLWNVRKVAIQERISPKQAFILELKFALLCHGTSKPVRRPRDQSVKGSFMQLDVFDKN
ncbi:glutamate receptor ionotropic, kainate 2-like isoform X2 [Lycorma delicatula]|uniref:glutamate receptor ionotropic, kainate 2-like isoform X2 n=1 Tax=Lycorma delicatula TaxID=130591 RepID=UPI003F51320F